MRWHCREEPERDDGEKGFHREVQGLIAERHGTDLRRAYAHCRNRQPIKHGHSHYIFVICLHGMQDEVGDLMLEPRCPRKINRHFTKLRSSIQSPPELRASTKGEKVVAMTMAGESKAPFEPALPWIGAGARG